MARGAKDSEGWGDSLKTVLREYAESLLIAILVAFLVRAYVVSAYQVPSSSMRPALQEGDFLFGYKLPYGVRLPFSAKKIGGAPPLRGELAIFRCPLSPSQRCTKRVVGLPGDRIEVKGKRLIVNGELASYEKAGELTDDGMIQLRESSGSRSYLILISQDKSSENFGPIIVPPGQFFALSDSRDQSQDSRQWGSIPFDHLEARPVIVWLSFDWGHPAPESSTTTFFTLPEVRWERLFHRVY